MRRALIYHHRERRQYAQDIFDFSSLIETPEDLGAADPGDPFATTVTLPANGRLAISASEALEAGDLVVNIGAEAAGIEDGAADTIYRLTYGEEGQTVEVEVGAGCPTCDVTLYVLDEWMRPFAIATGSVN